MRIAMIQDNKDAPALLEFLSCNDDLQYSIELTIEEAIYLTGQLQRYLFSVKYKIDETLQVVS
jgi:hypothetical protein